MEREVALSALEEATCERQRLQKAMIEAQERFKEARKREQEANDNLFYCLLGNKQRALAQRVDTLHPTDRLKEFVELVSYFLVSRTAAKQSDIHTDYYDTHAILHARGSCRLRVDIHGRVSHDTRHLPSPPHLNILEDDARKWNPLRLY